MSLAAFRLVMVFFVVFPLGIARYAFEKSHQEPFVKRTEIKQSPITDLGLSILTISSSFYTRRRMLSDFLTLRERVPQSGEGVGKGRV